MCITSATGPADRVSCRYLAAPDTAELPFAEAAERLRRAVQQVGAAVVQAPPGTGKTTLAPGIVLGAVTGAGSGRVIVTQPRRVAARASAARINELHAQVGGTQDIAGYTVRGESSANATTRIEFVTAGVLLRRLLNDPDLPGVRAVILDEVHERALDTDLALAMLAQLRELRDDLAVVAMSATVDAPAFARVLQAPVVAVDSPIHPLEIHYASTRTSISRRDRRAAPGRPGSLEDIVADTVVEALGATAGAGGDILAFAPTIRATEVIARRVTERTGTPAVALHGQLGAHEQAAIVRGRAATATPDTTPRRVIVATNIAESSLTIPGVRVVVDSCLARVNRRDSTRGMNALLTELCSQASATQRAGRAGREGPGTVFRCITAEEWAKFPAFSPPEIATADLTGALLDCAVWGAPGGYDLPLVDPFPIASAAAAQRQLEFLGAVTPAGEATDFSRRLSRLPMDPHLARGGLRAAELVDPETVAVVLQLLEQGRVPDDLPRAVAQADRRHPTVRRFARALRTSSTAELRGTDAVAYTVACAFPHLIARLAGDRLVTVGGTAASFASTPPASPNSWFAIADLTKAHTADGTGAIVRSAVPLDFDLACRAVDGGVHTTRRVEWDVQARKARGREVSALGAVELSSRAVRPSDAEAREALSGQLADKGAVESGVIPLSEDAVEFMARVQCGRAGGVSEYPDLTNGLPDTIIDYLVEDVIAGRTPDVVALLRGIVPWDKPIDEIAPRTIELPSGRSVRVRYPAVADYECADEMPGPPVVATKLQHCFGLRESPVIAGRRVQFQLLSPAQRPIAVTDDLANFWDGPYQQVRKEMRGRYPKHDWPERP